MGGTAGERRQAWRAARPGSMPGPRSARTRCRRARHSPSPAHWPRAPRRSGCPSPGSRVGGSLLPCPRAATYPRPTVRPWTAGRCGPPMPAGLCAYRGERRRPRPVARPRTERGLPDLDGALLPAGADAVLRREDGEESGGFLVAASAPRPGADVRPCGDDFRLGQELLAADTVVAAHEVAVVAAAGHAGAFCRRRIRVAFATTGDELVAPGDAVPRGGVIDSNLIGLVAQAVAAGATVCASTHAPDDRAATLEVLSGLLDEDPDVVITVGGISVGAHDHVGPALEQLEGGGRFAASQCARATPSAWRFAARRSFSPSPATPRPRRSASTSSAGRSSAHRRTGDTPRPSCAVSNARTRDDLSALHRGGPRVGPPRSPGFGTVELPRPGACSGLDRARRRDRRPRDGRPREQNAMRASSAHREPCVLRRPPWDGEPETRPFADGTRGPTGAVRAAALTARPRPPTAAIWPIVGRVGKGVTATPLPEPRTRPREGGSASG